MDIPLTMFLTYVISLHQKSGKNVFEIKSCHHCWNFSTENDSWLHADDLKENLLNISWIYCSKDNDVKTKILQDTNENWDQEDHFNF